MKLISVFVLAFSILSTGCISKPVRGTASVTPKNVSDYADYTMVNVVSVTRMPAGTGSVELSTPADPTQVTLDLWHSYGDNSQQADLTLTVRSNPAIAGRMSGHSRGSKTSQLFVAIMNDVRKNGWRPAAVPVTRHMQSKLGSLTQYPAEQHSEQIRVTLLEGRDQLFAVYSDLVVASK